MHIDIHAYSFVDICGTVLFSSCLVVAIHIFGNVVPAAWMVMISLFAQTCNDKYRLWSTLSLVCSNCFSIHTRYQNTSFVATYFTSTVNVSCS